MPIEFFSNKDPNLDKKLRFIKGEEEIKPEDLKEGKQEENLTDNQDKNHLSDSKKEGGYTKPPDRPQTPPKRKSGFI